MPNSIYLPQHVMFYPNQSCLYFQFQHMKAISVHVYPLPSWTVPIPTILSALCVLKENLHASNPPDCYLYLIFHFHLLDITAMYQTTPHMAFPFQILIYKNTSQSVLTIIL